MRFFILLLSLLLPTISFAADTNSRTSAWLMSLTRVKFSEKINGFLDIQPRFTMNDISGGDNGQIDTLLLRGALGYQITPNIGIYQGYGYIPTYDPNKKEHRYFQELLAIQPLNEVHTLTHRLRLEERDIDQVDDMAFRFRYFVRYTHPLTSIHEKLSLAINQEIFINLNDTDNGPKSGFDQNRLFLGFNYRVNKNVAYDFGYQNQYSNIVGGGNNISNHILFFGLLTNFSIMN